MIVMRQPCNRKTNNTTTLSQKQNYTATTKIIIK